MKRNLCTLIAFAAVVWVTAGNPHTAHGAYQIEGGGGGGGSTPPPEPSCGSSVGSFYKSASKYQSFGDYNMFWANYSFYGQLYGYDKSVAGTPADKLEMKARAYSDVRVFGYQRRIAEVKANAYSIYGNSIGGNLDVYRMGSNVYHRAWDRKLYFGWSQSRELFKKSKWFTVGIVPMRVTETVTGSLGFDVSGGPETDGVSATFEPWINADSDTNVGVDIVVTGVGVNAHVRLLRIGAPVFGYLWLTTDCLNWRLRVQATLKTIDGYVELWAKIWPTTWYLTIFSWNGYESSWTLLDQSGSISLK